MTPETLELIFAFVLGVAFGLLLNGVVFPAIFSVWLRLVRARRGYR